MTISTGRRTYLLQTLALLLSPSAFSSSSNLLVSAGKARLRGVKETKTTSQEQLDGKQASNTYLKAKDQQQRRASLSRTLYGLEYNEAGVDFGIDLTGYVPESSNSTNTSSLIGRPVFFEKQMDEPYTNPYARIVGGSDSPEQRNFCMHLRWDASSNQYVFAGCGGALISNCHVLTAAHCSAGDRAGLPDGVYCNAYNPFQGNYDREFHFSEIASINIHPDFDDVNNENDVAVLTLATCVDNLGNYPVMKVADYNFLGGLQENASLMVSGFGRLSESNTGQVETLQRVAVPYISSSTCTNYYPGRIYDDMVCAGSASGGLDACQGDSGGPLFYQGSGGDSDQTQVGIVSWGTGCAEPDKPGVYTSVAHHRDWIKNIACGDSRVSTGSIGLCSSSATPASSPASAPVSQDATRDTCASVLESCADVPCCGNLQCKARTVGAAPMCSTASSSSRNPLGAGRGGAGGAAKYNSA